MLTKDLKNSTHNHKCYYLLFDKSGQVFNLGEHNFESPSPSRSQQAIQKHEYGVIDLTDESKTTFMQHYVYCPHNNNNNDLQFPTHLFMSIAPELVDDLPEDIDCMKILLSD